MDVNVCIFSTTERPFVKNYTNSLEKYNWNYSKIGSDNDYKYELEGQKYRLTETLSFLKSRSSKELIILSDAYGCLCIKNSNDIASIFSSFQTSSVMACKEERTLLTNSVVKKPNSSFVMGYVGNLISIIEWAKKEKGINEYNQCWTTFYNDHPDMMSIDDKNKLFFLLRNNDNSINIGDSLSEPFTNAYFIKVMDMKPSMYNIIESVKQDNYKKIGLRTLDREEFTRDSYTDYQNTQNIQITILIFVILIFVLMVIIVILIFLNMKRARENNIEHIVVEHRDSQSLERPFMRRSDMVRKHNEIEIL